jgi:Ni,Fe-hydrogenase III small subunit
MWTPVRATAAKSEIHALNNPYYNLEGLGIKFVASPRHADLLLVTGPVSRNMDVALRNRSSSSPWATAAAMGMFGESYATCGAVSSVIPVDVAVTGCPPPPVAIIQGILTAVSARR